MRWIVPPIERSAPTAWAVATCIAVICAPISPGAFAVCVASDFSSEATTAKPLPASPARAASIVAFNASRLVCPAMSGINRTTSPIRPAASLSPVMQRSVAAASVTA